MSTKRIGFKIVAGGLVALMVLLGAAFVLPRAASAAGALGSRVSRAANQVVAAVTGEPATFTHFGPGGGGPGFGGHHGGGLGADETYLAEALDITVEELQAAKEEALEAALAQAVDDGLITQAQADEILTNGGWGWHGLGHSQDMENYLAEALDISVEELEAAKSEAYEAAVNDALEAGTITQEQADYLLAKNAIRSAIDEQSVIAGVLGLTAEEYEAARSEGSSLETLIEEASLTVAEYQTAVNEAYQAAVQELVEAGTVTQAQADLVLSDGAGLGFGRGFGGRGFGGHGGPGFGGNCPFGSPSQDSESVTPAADA